MIWHISSSGNSWNFRRTYKLYRITFLFSGSWQYSRCESRNNYLCTGQYLLLTLSSEILKNIQKYFTTIWWSIKCCSFVKISRKIRSSNVKCNRQFSIHCLYYSNNKWYWPNSANLKHVLVVFILFWFVLDTFEYLMNMFP